MPALKTMEIKSNEATIIAWLGWRTCADQIDTYESCKKTGSPYLKNPEECYTLARKMHQCYEKKGMKIQPLCMPIFNDTKECLFQADSTLLHCKEELNELDYCNNHPDEYVSFLMASTPHQKLPKKMNYSLVSPLYELNG